ncbi:RAPGEF2 [Lepeophtheirus salmonis]|uniref:RAPGEF2 n=1 Tax=Lepeophtheirus salmonis TaxID=72036 RepID=A0A7R8D591_LEPSM|nr:RAPGEF2 [Lepeophtheirus salmonis]CAF3033908.1 RAPGEF2 [Lepeophtheirus salmonis]
MLTPHFGNIISDFSTSSASSASAHNNNSRSNNNSNSSNNSGNQISLHSHHNIQQHTPGSSHPSHHSNGNTHHASHQHHTPHPHHQHPTPPAIHSSPHLNKKIIKSSRENMETNNNNSNNNNDSSANANTTNTSSSSFKFIIIFLFEQQHQYSSYGTGGSAPGHPPKAWEKSGVNFDVDEYKLEYMDLDEFLLENNMNLDSVLQQQQQQQQGGNASVLEAVAEEQRSRSQLLRCSSNGATGGIVGRIHPPQPPPSSSLDIPVQVVSPQQQALRMPPRSPDDVVVKSENEGSTPVEALRICGGTNDDGTPNNSLHHPQLHAPHHVHVQQQQVQQQVNHHHAHHTVAHELMDPSLRISGYFGGSGSISDDNSRKKKKILVSDEKKDDKYWERRRKKQQHGRKALTGCTTFGKRIGGASRRHNECLILEPSEMIVIDYVDGRGRTEKIIDSSSSSSNSNNNNTSDVVTVQQTYLSEPEEIQRPPPRKQHGSDSSSAYSGSDTMLQSVEEMDLSGLLESVVDSDVEEEEEDDEEEESTGESPLIVRDAVRDCLEKDPSDRSDDDVEVLLEFTQHLKAFTNMTMSVRRALVSTMVFAVVEKAGTVVMTDGEELDSWSVIINGSVEIERWEGGNKEELHLGDSFGITPTTEKLYHKGIMREENQFRHEEDGRLVMITEHRRPEKADSSRSTTPINNQSSHHSRGGHVVIRGTPERLTAQLVEDGSVDSSFIEDFLLTYRTFISDPIVVFNRLLEWFEDGSLRDKVTRVILLWVNNHFTDFETDLRMMTLLEKFEKSLEAEGMNSQLRMMNFACAAKARKKDGYAHPVVERRVTSLSGLKRGDEILEVNGQIFTALKLPRALDVLKGNAKKRWNPLSLQMTLHMHLELVIQIGVHHHLKSPNVLPNLLSLLQKTHKLNRAFNRLLHKPKSMISMDTVDDSSVINSNYYPNNNNNNSSLSNPDLTDNSFEETYTAASVAAANSYPEHVLKIYRADQSLKYLLVHKETTAREVVMLALQEFGCTEPSSNYALVEVTVAEGGFVKQRRLPDALQNLAERMGLASRYYIKSVGCSETLLPDDAAAELQKDSSVSLLHLNSVEVATQLMVEDFTIFRQIEGTEYVTDLFGKKSRYGNPNLTRFSQLVNREMMWAITEIVMESSNLNKRMRIIKQFIKIARQCKETQNFNSMFAIISGLGHASVSRLKATWEKVPAKYLRIFHEMQQLMDPSRNMSRYRNLVNGEDVQPPIIPFYPIVKKDLTFIHIANDSVIDNLVNFEKLRMIAKEVRSLTNMCSAPLDLFSMLELGGQQPSNAMVAMNQLSTGGQHLATVNRRRKKTTGLPNPKRMFEEAQMVRRVKSYLKNMRVVIEEEALHRMSLECEPPPGAMGGLKRNPSPTPSAVSSTSSNSERKVTLPPHGASTTTSSNSSAIPPPPPLPSTSSSGSSSGHHQKFASPHAVKKLLSLSEQAKPIRSSSSSSKNTIPQPPLPPPPHRSHHGHHQGHLHHHPPEPIYPIPVDLTAESSSVTSITASRRVKYHHPASSVTSTDSGLSSYDDYSRQLSYSRRRRVPPPPLAPPMGFSPPMKEEFSTQSRNRNRISKSQQQYSSAYYIMSDPCGAGGDDDDEDDGDEQVSAV